MKDKSLSLKILIAIVLGNLTLPIVLIATQNIFSAKIIHLVILLAVEIAAILTYYIVRFRDRPDPEELDCARGRLLLERWEGAKYGEPGTEASHTDIIRAQEEILRGELG